MITKRRPLNLVAGAGVVLWGITALTGTSAQSSLEPRLGNPLVLGVPDRVNTAVQLASTGETVAAVWSARALTASAGDVLLAMSHDGGRTFTPPRYVNARRGSAEVGGEQPPAVALRSPKELYVVWRSVDGQQNTILAVYSHDGGASFSEPTAVHDTGSTAFRGFQSAAVGH